MYIYVYVYMLRVYTPTFNVLLTKVTIVVPNYMYCMPTPDECGIVAQVSAPLAHAEISTYYICTFFTDHTLVRYVHVSHSL